MTSRTCSRLMWLLPYSPPFCIFLIPWNTKTFSFATGCVGCPLCVGFISPSMSSSTFQALLLLTLTWQAGYWSKILLWCGLKCVLSQGHVKYQKLALHDTQIMPINKSMNARWFSNLNMEKSLLISDLRRHDHLICHTNHLVWSQRCPFLSFHPLFHPEFTLSCASGRETEASCLNFPTFLPTRPFHQNFWSIKTLRSSSVTRTTATPEKFISRSLCGFTWSPPSSPSLDTDLSPTVSLTLPPSPSSPLLPLSRRSPPPPLPFSLLLSVAAPRPRHLSFKRFSLFSRLPGKLRHVWVLLTPRTGGVRGWVGGKPGSWLARCGFEIFAHVALDNYWWVN